MTDEYKAYKDRDQLYKLYRENGWSVSDIAVKFEVSPTDVEKAIEECGLKESQEREAVEGVSYSTLNGYTRWDHSDPSYTVYVHQLLAISEGHDPKKVFSSGEYHIHHENGVRWDNRPENIELLTPQEHVDEHPERGSDKEYSNEEMLGWIGAFVDEFGFVPYHTDIDGWPGPHYMTYVNRFGSWTEAVNEAGWKSPNHQTDKHGNIVSREDPKPIERKD